MPNDCLKTRKITLPNFSRQNTSKCLNDSKLLWSQSSSEIEKKLNYPDIIHSNNFFCPTKLNKTKLVYTLYDLSFLEYPQWTTEANRLACFNGMLSASLYADHLISISEYTKKNFLEVFSHVDEKKISVVYPGQRYEKSSPILKKPSHLPALKTNQFWLNVGTIEPRKNQEGLLRAYALF